MKSVEMQLQMERRCKIFNLLQLVIVGVVTGGAADLHVKPPVRTADTGGYQLTNNAHVGGWVLRIMAGNRFACGAAYYSPLYVLTSAGCMHRYKSQLDELSVEPLFGQQFAMIESINVPKQYRYPKNYMDIAVVKLVDPIFGAQTFVQLCRRPLQEHKKLTVVSCGTKNRELRTEQINLLKPNDCERQYANLRLSDTIACTHSFNQVSECMYDFGCPVTADNELCGIVAFGPECNRENLPGLFTDIYQVKHFISKVIRKSDKKITKQTWFDK